MARVGLKSGRKPLDQQFSGSPGKYRLLRREQRRLGAWIYPPPLNHSHNRLTLNVISKHMLGHLGAQRDSFEHLKGRSRFSLELPIQNS
jgi:hypothetical protein